MCSPVLVAEIRRVLGGEWFDRAVENLACWSVFYKGSVVAGVPEESNVVGNALCLQ